MKEIILDVLNETGEVKIETKGFFGKKCIEESEFLKKALGKEVERNLNAYYYEIDKETNNAKRTIKNSFCG